MIERKGKSDLAWKGGRGPVFVNDKWNHNTVCRLRTDDDNGDGVAEGLAKQAVDDVVVCGK